MRGLHALEGEDRGYCSSCVHVLHDLRLKRFLLISNACFLGTRLGALPVASIGSRIGRLLKKFVPPKICEYWSYFTFNALKRMSLLTCQEVLLRPR